MKIIEAIVFTSNLDSCGRNQSEQSIYIKPDIQQVFEWNSLLDYSMI